MTAALFGIGNIHVAIGGNPCSIEEPVECSRKDYLYMTGSLDQGSPGYSPEFRWFAWRLTSRRKTGIKMALVIFHAVCVGWDTKLHASALQGKPEVASIWA